MLLGEIENDQKKAQLISAVLQQKIATAPCPMPDETMYECQMLSETVTELLSRACTALRQCIEGG